MRQEQIAACKEVKVSNDGSYDDDEKEEEEKCQMIPMIAPGEEEGKEQAARNKLQISEGVWGQTITGGNVVRIRNNFINAGNNVSDWWKA